ncbi:MAG: SMI1/KNR4 family protein [Porphyromonadaceae bacterium]|nr:SMI1/KNR4 family protein [Porphyromonadaceae bacterium]
MDYLKYALEKQEINPDIEIFGGVAIEQINDAEKKLGILFPSQYKEFLLACGSCGIADTYVSGLFKEWDNLTSTGSIVHDTIEAREKHNLPNEYIVIEYMVDENYYVLKTSENDRIEDGKIYSIDINSDGSLSSFCEIFDSFVNYLKFILER